jgi:hypothetical protein
MANLPWLKREIENPCVEPFIGTASGESLIRFANLGILFSDPVGPQRVGNP